MFHPKLLRPYANNPLPGQSRGPPKAIHFDGGDEYAVDDILESRHYHGRLQYKVEWEDVDRDEAAQRRDKGKRCVRKILQSAETRGLASVTLPPLSHSG